MSDLTIRKEELPAKVRELQKKVEVGKANYKQQIAAIRALERIKDKDTADQIEATRKIAVLKTIDDLEEAWRMHAALGRIVSALTGGKRGGDWKSDQMEHVPLDSIGLSLDDSRYARGMAEAEEAGMFETILAKMRTAFLVPRYMQPYVALKHETDGPEDTAPLPDGQYAVIMADPPWDISTSDWDVKWRPEDTIADKYPRMSVEAIKAMPVEEKAGPECSLFLWTTHTFLPDAIEVMRAWDFKYHACLTWDKGGGFTHLGLHRRTEFLLYGYRGGMNLPIKGPAIPTVFSEAKREHSRKPEKAYAYIEERFPAPRLELFGRHKREGWVVWGNEA